MAEKEKDVIGPCGPLGLNGKAEARRPGARAVEPSGAGGWVPTRTLRDDYAMAALAGLLGNPENMGVSPENLCLRAFRVADAALVAREVRA